MSEAISPFNKKLKAKRAKYFPMKLNDGFSCDLVSRKVLDEYLVKQFKNVFNNEPERLYFKSVKPSRQRKINSRDLRDHYLHIHTERILFYDKSGKKVGWTFGESEDFQTYYMRNTGMLPKHQGNKVYSTFLESFMKYLAELGYERISSQHHGDNPKVLIPKLKAGFIITGIENHENWGSLIKLVKHLKTDRRKTYQQKFN